MSPAPALQHDAEGANPEWPVPIFAAAEVMPWPEWEALTETERLEEVQHVLFHAMAAILRSADRHGVLVDVDTAPGWELTQTPRTDGPWAILSVTARGKPHTHPGARLN